MIRKLFLYVFSALIYCDMMLAESSLPECEGNEITNPIKKYFVAKKWSNCHGTFLDLKGNPGYIGEFLKGQPNGEGIFQHAGRKYIGQWKKGKQHGQGTYIYSNGDKYVGEWKKGKYYGDGIYTYANGDQYIGEWKKNKYNKPDNLSERSGQGTYIYANGDKYVGKWKKGLKHGKGILTYSNGRVEKGIWKNDKFVKRK